VSKGQKVTKTGYKWKFDPCSKNNLPNHRFIQFDICDAWKYQKRCCQLLWYAYGVIFSVIAGLPKVYPKFSDVPHSVLQ